MTQEDEILTRFKLVCLRCGSERVVVNISNSWDRNGTDLQICCNGCNTNDLHLDVTI